MCAMDKNQLTSQDVKNLSKNLQTENKSVVAQKVSAYYNCLLYTSDAADD